MKFLKHVLEVLCAWLSQPDGTAAFAVYVDPYMPGGFYVSLYEMLPRPEPGNNDTADQPD